MTKAKAKNNSVLIALGAFVFVVFIVGMIGYFAIGRDAEIIQGQIDVEEYRVSSKVPSRVLHIYVKEGDYVNVGDTLAILEAPELTAKATQAQGAIDAATALSNMANNGARKEQIQGAYELWQQAKAAKEIAEKSYNRVQRLFDEGVMTAQKRDEAFAMYKASEAQEKAAKSQYDMAVNGARAEEKAAAQGQVKAFSGQMDEVKVYEKETIQIAPIAGEVSTIYPKVGEVLGSGSPIMTISIMDDIWGAFNMREEK